MEAVNTPSTESTINYDTMNVGFRLKSVNYENKTCVLQVYSGRKSRVLDDVYISGLLASKMINEKSASYYAVGKKYSSDNNEFFRKKNPFQLIKYLNKEGALKYLLTVVEDAGRETIYKGTDILGNKMYVTRFKDWKKKQYYRRFVDHTPEVVTAV